MRGRHGPVHVEAAHRRLFGAIPACLSPPPPATARHSGLVGAEMGIRDSSAFHLVYKFCRAHYYVAARLWDSCLLYTSDAADE